MRQKHKTHYPIWVQLHSFKCVNILFATSLLETRKMGDRTAIVSKQNCVPVMSVFFFYFESQNFLIALPMLNKHVNVPVFSVARRRRFQHTVQSHGFYGQSGRCKKSKFDHLGNGSDYLILQHPNRKSTHLANKF